MYVYLTQQTYVREFREAPRWPCNTYKRATYKIRDGTVDITAKTRPRGEVEGGCDEFSGAEIPLVDTTARAFVSRSRALSRLRSQSRSRRWQPLIPVLVPRGEPTGLRLHVESLPVLIFLRPPNSTNPGWHCMVTNTLRHVFRRTNHCRVPTTAEHPKNSVTADISTVIPSCSSSCVPPRVVNLRPGSRDRRRLRDAFDLPIEYAAAS